MDNTLLQGYSALAFLYGGIVIGICLDCNRILRAALSRRILTHFADALFIILLFVICNITFHLATRGAFRVYGILLLIGGVCFQQWTFGRTICKRIVKRRE